MHQASSIQLLAPRAPNLFCISAVQLCRTTPTPIGPPSATGCTPPSPAEQRIRSKLPCHAAMRAAGAPAAAQPVLLARAAPRRAAPRRAAPQPGGELSPGVRCFAPRACNAAPAVLTPPRSHLLVSGGPAHGGGAGGRRVRRPAGDEPPLRAENRRAPRIPPLGLPLSARSRAPCAPPADTQRPLDEVAAEAAAAAEAEFAQAQSKSRGLAGDLGALFNGAPCCCKACARPQLTRHPQRSRAARTSRGAKTAPSDERRTLRFSACSVS